MRGSQRPRPMNVTPPTALVDASTAAMITGRRTGKNNTGSMISRDRVCTAIAENSVPTTANPRVPKRIVSIKDQGMGIKEYLHGWYI